MSDAKKACDDVVIEIGTLSSTHSTNNEERIKSLHAQLVIVKETAVKHRERAAARSKNATIIRTSVHVLDVISLCSLATLFGSFEEYKWITLLITAVFSTTSAVFSTLLTSFQLDRKASADKVNSRVLFDIWSWHSNRLLMNNMTKEEYTLLFHEFSNRLSQYRNSEESLL